MNLVESFKKKIAEIEEKSGTHYKICYAGYKQALENNRLHPYWHKPCVLAEISKDKSTVVFELTGNLEADLINPVGEIIKSFKGCITPCESDDTQYITNSGIYEEGVEILNDEDLKPYIDGDYEGWHISFTDETYIKIYNKDNPEKVEVIATDSLARPIFDTELINKMLAVPKEEEAKPKKKEPEKKAEKKSEKKIQDSGQRTEFESGAVRDIQKGKGRCDLLPLDIVGLFMMEEGDAGYNFLETVSDFQENGEVATLIHAAHCFATQNFEDKETAILEYACHMEDGCNKYGERNWQKGIPMNRYIDSAIRHYLKFKRGDDDERHDRAVLWNLLCGAWTCVHLPELNVYKK